MCLTPDATIYKNVVMMMDDNVVKVGREFPNIKDTGVKAQMEGVKMIFSHGYSSCPLCKMISIPDEVKGSDVWIIREEPLMDNHCST